jgi:hypothetical protein
MVSLTEFQRGKKTLEIGTFVAALAAAIAAGIYAYITNKMWSEMQTQTKTQQQQLENSDRPWIKVVGVETTDLKFTEKGDLSISFKPSFKNIGRAVATYVSVNSKLFLQDEKGDFFKEPIVRQKELCEELARSPLGPSPKTVLSMGEPIFPEDTDNEFWYGNSVLKSEIDQRKHNVALKSGPGAILFPLYIGCVDYQFGTATRHHQTGFAYSLRRRDRTIPPGFVNEVAIRVGLSVPKEDVILERWEFGGFYAN